MAKPNSQRKLSLLDDSARGVAPSRASHAGATKKKSFGFGGCSPPLGAGGGGAPMPRLSISCCTVCGTIQEGAGVGWNQGQELREPDARAPTHDCN